MIGIDLGTTNSVIAFWHGETAHVIPDAGGRRLTPSVVGVDEDGSILVGEAARQRLITHPDATVAAFKRRMGTTSTVQLAPGMVFRAEELSALVLKKLLSDASNHLGHPVDRCVVSVPAYFNDTQRKATRDAAKIAGIDAFLINEPTAAAIAYGVHTRIDQQKIAIVDLGGGTLDISILEFFDGVMEVHATAGDNWLGGEDFDSVIVQATLEKLNLDEKKLTTHQRSAIRASAQRAKHALSTGHSTNVSITLDPGKSSSTRETSLTRAEFEERCKPLLHRVQRTLERALKDARLGTTAVNQVILVGGSTRMPIIRNLVGRLFGQLPLTHLNPDEIVGMGAAVQAAMRDNDAALEDFVLTDVCPYTLGVEVAVETSSGGYEQGHFMPIIERNSPVPVSRVETINPISRTQKQLLCKVYQGESRLTANNVLLGSIEVDVPLLAKDRSVDVRFTFDNEGLLEVTTEVKANTTRKSLLINNSGKTLSDAQIREKMEKLENLKIHPKDRQEHRTAVVRAERLYEENLGDNRTVIADGLRKFEAVLASQDTNAAEAARKEFMTFLDQFDQDVFR